jgi:hypothetical protein
MREKKSEKDSSRGQAEADKRYSIEGLTDHARTSDIPHRRSPRGSFSSQSPENTCRPVGHQQRHRGLPCDGLDGVWKDQRA